MALGISQLTLCTKALAITFQVEKPRLKRFKPQMTIILALKLLFTNIFIAPITRAKKTMMMITTIMMMPTPVTMNKREQTNRTVTTKWKLLFVTPMLFVTFCAVLSNYRPKPGYATVPSIAV